LKSALCILRLLVVAMPSTSKDNSLNPCLKFGVHFIAVLAARPRVLYQHGRKCKVNCLHGSQCKHCIDGICLQSAYMKPQSKKAEL
jgi:hypothetical protein